MAAEVAAGYQWPTEEDPLHPDLVTAMAEANILGDIVVQMEGGPGSEQLVEALEEADTRLREAESQHLGIVQLAELFLGHYENIDDYMLVDHAMYARDINALLAKLGNEEADAGLRRVLRSQALLAKPAQSGGAPF